MIRRLPLAALFAVLVIFSCGEKEEPEVPLADSLEALFPLADGLLSAALALEEEGFDTAAWLVRVDAVPATHELARRAKASLRRAVTAFGSYAVGRLPNDYAIAMDHYHRFEETMDEILEEVTAQR